MLDHSEHLLHNHHASVASLRLLFTFAPERRSASLRNRCSPSPEYPADEQIRRVADEFVCVHKPEWFFGIGQFYENFSQTEDSEVHALLEGAAEALVAAGKSEKTRTA